MTDKLQTPMTRPTWQHREFHLIQWKEKNITVLICQRKTKNMVQLCLESLLRFYPDIPILLVDGDSQDESTLYLKYMQAKHPNITLWERPLPGGGKFSSHGVTMDEAINAHIRTKYVLLLDSDTIIERGGWIEEMLDQFKGNKNLYAIGTLMLVSRENDACGNPHHEDDVLRYAHPSCSIYDVHRYLQMPPFCDHGSPCCYSMQAAEKAGLEIGYYPIELYVSHLSGASWCEPATIWPNDHDVLKRPFLSFVADEAGIIMKEISLSNQTDHDFEIIPLTVREHSFVTLHEHNLNMNTSEMDCYPIRFRVNGEYVCDIREWDNMIQPEFVKAVKEAIISYQFLEKKLPDELVVGGLICTERKFWQRKMIK